MFIELVGSLRCVHPHELTWLVASAYRMEDRDIVSGELGCPECGARYPVERGVADFRELGSTSVSPEPIHEPSARQPSAGPEPPEHSRAHDVAEGAAPAEEALRLAALLDLTNPGGGGMVVVAGGWGAAAGPLASGEIVERTHILALDAPPDIASGGGVSLALTRGLIPVRPSTARGIALDEAHSSPSYLASAAEALRPAARLLAPVRSTIPEGLTELARDERSWLAVKSGPVGGVVQLGRTGSAGGASS